MKTRRAWWVALGVGALIAAVLLGGAAWAEFPQAAPETPAAIGEIVLELHDVDGDPANMTGTYDITVLNAAGEGIRRLRGDILDQASATVKVALRDALLAARAQAEAEVLPQ